MIKVMLFIGGLVSAVFLILVIALCGYAQAGHPSLTTGSATSSVAEAALSLQEHIFGSRSNEYDLADPFMQPVLDYWAASCPGTGPDGICALAESGNLQCVEFVTAAYWLGGDPLPLAPNAEQFWDAYGSLPDWQQIPSPSAFPDAAKQAPNLGDLMVFQGGAHMENGQMVEYGHIGIVVSFTAPDATQDGSIEIAEANGPGTKFPPASLNPFVASDKSGNTYVMTVKPSYKIDTWGPYTADGVSYSGMTVLGFLHHRVSLPTPTAGHVAEKVHEWSFATRSVQEACDDAERKRWHLASLLAIRNETS